MNTAHDFDDLDDYLHDRLHEVDRKALEEALAADPQLALRLKALQAEEQVTHYLRKKDLQKKLARWENEPAPARRKLFWPLAITGALLFAVLLWCYWPKPSAAYPSPTGAITRDTTLHAMPSIGLDTTSTFLHSEKENRGPASITPRPQASYRSQSVGMYEDPFADRHMAAASPSALADTSCYGRAMMHYAAAHYSLAVRALRHCADTSRSEDVHYLLGHAYFHLHRYQPAAAEFGLITPASDHHADAQWYKLLSLLAQMPATRQDFEAQLLLVEKSPVRTRQLQELKDFLPH